MTPIWTICEPLTNLTTVRRTISKIFGFMYEFVLLIDLNLKTIKFELFLTYNTHLFDANTDVIAFESLLIIYIQRMPAWLSACSLFWISKFDLSILNISPLRNQSSLPFREHRQLHLMDLLCCWKKQ